MPVLSRCARRAAFAALLALAAVAPAQTPTNTWTSAVTGAWSNPANWDTNPAVPASASTTVLQFNGSGVVGVNSVNDLASPFTLNGVLFNSSDTGGFLVSGNALTFVTNSTTSATPVLSQNNSGGVGVSQALTATNLLTVGGSGSGPMLLSGAITNTGGLSVNNPGFDVTTTGVISGGGSLAKSGNGALTLAGANTYTAGTTLNGGTLNINNAGSTTASALGTGILVINGGNLGNTSGGGVTFTLTTPITQTWGGSFGYNSANNLTLGAGAVTMTTSPTVTVSGAGILIENGIISGSGLITKAGNGTLRLAGANTFTGGVTVNGGTLQLGNPTALGTAASRLTLNDGTTIDANAATTLTTANPQTWNGNFNFAGTATLTFGAGAITLGAPATVTVDASTLTVPGTITGSGFNITKAGTGTLVLSAAIQTGTGAVMVNAGPLTLSGTNTFSGGVTLNTGTLNVNNASALGTGTFTIINGGTLNNSSGAAITLSTNNAQTWGADFTFTGGNSLNLGTGAVTLIGNRAVTTNANTLTVGGVISGGGFSLTKLGAGTLALTAANTYTGGTVVNGGTLIGTAQAAGSPFGTGPVTLNAGTLRVNGIASATTTPISDLTVGTALALVVDNTASGGTTVAAGNLTRTGTGVLTVTPVVGTLGTGENVTFTAAPALVSGILPAWVVAQASGTNTAGDFVTNGGGGLAVATYTSTDLTTSTSADVVNQSTVPTIAGNVPAYALKTNQAISLGTNTLFLGNGNGPAGLILNTGAALTGGTLSLGGAEGVVYTQSAATISSTISNGSLTAFGPGTLTLSGTNNYAGGSALMSGTVILGNSSALGTGPITLGGAAVQASTAVSLTNNVTLAANTTLSGTSGFTFTSPSTLTVSGGNRTLTNATGQPLILNNIVLGDAATGRVLTLNGGTTPSFTINGQVTDPAGAPAGVAGITIATATTTLTLNNGTSTYTGPTTLGNATAVLVGADSNSGPFTQGPFGVGNIVTTSTTTASLRPIGANRLVANNIVTNGGGFTTNNDASGPTLGITLTGNVTIADASRSLTNSMAMGTGGTTTYNGPFISAGNATSDLTVTIAGAGATVVNNVIRDSGLGGKAILGITNTNNTTQANPGTGTVIGGVNTYTGGTSITGARSTVVINSSQPFGVGGLVTISNATNPVLIAFGADRHIANTILLGNAFTVGDTTTVTTPYPAQNLFFDGTLIIAAGAASHNLNNSISNATGKAFTVNGDVWLSDSTLPASLNFQPTGTATIPFTTIFNGVIRNNDPALGAGAPNGVTYAATGGTFQINNLNTYTGGTTATAQNTVQIGSNQPFGDPNAVTAVLTIGNANGTTLQAINADRTIGNAVTMSQNVTVSGAFSLTTTGVFLNSGAGRVLTNSIAAGKSLTIAGPYFLSEAAASARNPNFVGTGKTVISGVVSNYIGVGGTASGIVVASATVPSGFVQLTNTNTYTGSNVINTGGTMSVGADLNLGAVPAAATAGSIQVAGGTLQSTGSFALSSNRGIALGPTAGGTGIIEVTGSNTVTYGGIMANNTGVGALNKIGSGTLSLSGVNSYTGNTTVTAGTLALTGGGSIATSPVITVGPTASGPVLDVSGASPSPYVLTASQTIMGFGTVNGAITVNGTVAPGGSIGTETFTGDLTLGGTYTAEVSNAPAADKLAITGNLTLGGASLLNLPGANTYDGTSTYTLASYIGTLTGVFSNFPTGTEAGLPAGYMLNYGSGANSAITLTPVPEPGSVMLASLAAAGGLGWWRRRRAR